MPLFLVVWVLIPRKSWRDWNILSNLISKRGKFRESCESCVSWLVAAGLANEFLTAENSWAGEEAGVGEDVPWAHVKLYKSTYWYHINYSHLNLLQELPLKTKLLFCCQKEYLKVWFDCQNVIWFINDNNLQETSVTVSGVRDLLSCTLFVLLKPRPLVWGVVPVQC